MNCRRRRRSATCSAPWSALLRELYRRKSSVATPLHPQHSNTGALRVNSAVVGRMLLQLASFTRLAANMGVDLPAVATWCEKALPFLLLLLCTFIYRHIQGGAFTVTVVP